MRNRKMIILIGMSPLPVIAALVVLHFQAACLTLEGHQRLTKEALPNGQAVASLTLSPAALAGGDSSTGTITLRQPAQAGGVVVTLSNGGQSTVRTPKSVTVPAGQTSATFTVATGKVAAHTPVNLSVSFEGGTQTERLMLLPPARAEWYAAPEGRARGQGTHASPWDLATALAGGPSGTEVKPGDTIWLRGGRYAGTFTSTLSGDANAPVIVRQYPGERATLDRAGVSAEKQPALKVRGPWVWFWGFEVMNSHADRSRRSPYTKTDEPWRGSGADVYAPHVKFINMVFHDNGHGIWDKEDGTEVTGCLFYYNGNNKREHAVYTGNAEGTKFITDNIVFAQGGYGILAHSNSAKSSQRGLHIEGNAVFNNGALTRDDQTTGNLQVGGVRGVPAERIVLKNNYVYSPPGAAPAKSHGIRLGYEDKGNRDVRVLDNYIVGRTPLRLWWWQSVEFLGNTVYSQGESLELLVPAGSSDLAYRWDFNTYLAGREGGPAFVKDSNTFSFARWQQATGLDGHSRVLQGERLRPEGVRVFVRPNRYEEGRAHIIVYNWDLREQVAVDLSSVLPAGALFEVRDAQNYFGEPVARGRATGAPVLLPMKLDRIATPVGGVERAPSHTAPEFAAFVLRRIADTGAPRQKS